MSKGDESPNFPSYSYPLVIEWFDSWDKIKQARNVLRVRLDKELNLLQTV